MNAWNILTGVAALWGIVFGTKTVVDLIIYGRKHIIFKVNRLVTSNIIGAVAVLVLSLVIPFSLGLFNHTPKPPADFKVTSLQNGQVIQQQDLPLQIRGTDSSEGTGGKVWVILADARGGYYLNSQVNFESGGTWVARNVQPLEGIVEIDFVFVDQAGHSHFLGMIASSIAHKSFSSFQALPDNSTIVATVSITSHATKSVGRLQKQPTCGTYVVSYKVHGRNFQLQYRAK